MYLSEVLQNDFTCSLDYYFGFGVFLCRFRSVSAQMVLYKPQCKVLLLRPPINWTTGQPDEE
jgi:hypothetical protein